MLLATDCVATDHGQFSHIGGQLASMSTNPPNVLQPTRVYCPKVMSIGSAVFAQRSPRPHYLKISYVNDYPASSTACSAGDAGKSLGAYFYFLAIANHNAPITFTHSLSVCSVNYFYYK